MKCVPASGTQRAQPQGISPGWCASSSPRAYWRRSSPAGEARSVVMLHATAEAMAHHLQVLSQAASWSRGAGAGRGMAHHAQAAAVPQSLLLLLPVGSPEPTCRRGAAATGAWLAPGQPLLTVMRPVDARFARPGMVTASGAIRSL
jgi:hypothetical protein